LLYYHPRLGKNGKSILVIKFRTMHLNSAPPEGSDTDTLHMKPENDNRVTAIGRLLRKYSLDEMPQYINVLKGELSLIGPRAITPDEAEAYGVHRDLILSVLPGITGWWQVNGRNNMTWERRVELELDYVTNPSWKKDAFIIFKTIFVILKGTGR
jgi:lipopolysaccharide/colanic/teichoic acid biosynthesis glycosyltransferase